MKLLVLLSIVACSAARMVYPNLGFVPLVHSPTIPTLKTGQQQVTNIGFQQPLLTSPWWSYPFQRFIATPAVKSDVENEVPVTDKVEPVYYNHFSPFYFPGHFPSTYFYPKFPPAAEAPKTEEEQTPVVQERKKRSVVVGPVLQTVPVEQKVQYKTLEQTDDPTPADTTKLEVVSKTQKVTIPTYTYVQPTLPVQPLTYSVPTSGFGTHFAFPPFLPFGYQNVVY